MDQLEISQEDEGFEFGIRSDRVVIVDIGFADAVASAVAVAAAAAAAA